MACEHLLEGRLVCCRAVSGILVPSVREREQYCRGDQNFRRCPTWEAARVRNRRLAQAEYYELWTAPRLPPLVPRAPQLRDVPEADAARVTLVHIHGTNGVQRSTIKAG